MIILQKGEETRYPVPYYRWSLGGGSNSRPSGDGPNFRPRENGTVPLDASPAFHVELWQAAPIDAGKSNSPWLIRPESLDAELAGLIGPSDYTAHAGACSGGANGVYWLQILGRVPGGLRVANLAETSKVRLPLVERTIEPGLLYPLLRWSDVSRWRATPSCYLLLRKTRRRRRGIDEPVMRERYPGTFAYLSEFRERLVARVAYRRYQSRAAFYSMYDVGPYTVAPIKVVWRRMDRRITAAVAEPGDDPWLGRRPPVPQETCSLIAAASGDEAHYLCAVLNSAVANFIACSHAVRGGKGFGTPGHARLPAAAAIPAERSAAAAIGRPQPPGPRDGRGRRGDRRSASGDRPGRRRFQRAFPRPTGRHPRRGGLARISHQM